MSAINEQNSWAEFFGCLPRLIGDIVVLWRHRSYDVRMRQVTLLWATNAKTGVRPPTMQRAMTNAPTGASASEHLALRGWSTYTSVSQPCHHFTCLWIFRVIGVKWDRCTACQEFCTKMQPWGVSCVRACNVHGMKNGKMFFRRWSKMKKSVSKLIETLFNWSNTCGCT